MKYNVVCKKIELSEGRKEKLLGKFKKLEKFFDPDTDCKILIYEQKDDMVVEVTILYKGFFLRAEARDRDLIASADECLANLDRQIRKNKTKLAKQVREARFESYETVTESIDSVADEKEAFKIIKRKKFSSKPMSAEEAVLQMNLLGHDFFVFVDTETMKNCIVYRRKDGNYGLLENE